MSPTDNRKTNYTLNGIAFQFQKVYLIFDVICESGTDLYHIQPKELYYCPRFFVQNKDLIYRYDRGLENDFFLNF